MPKEIIKKLAVTAAINMPEKEAAPYIGVSVHTLRRWRVYGGGPTYLKCGSRVLYPRGALDEFLASCVRRSTSDPGPAAKMLQGGTQAAKVTHIGKGIQAPAAGCSSAVEGTGGSI